MVFYGNFSTEFFKGNFSKRFFVFHRDVPVDLSQREFLFFNWKVQVDLSQIKFLFFNWKVQVDLSQMGIFARKIIQCFAILLEIYKFQLDCPSKQYRRNLIFQLSDPFQVLLFCG